jgi:hypothetical protein
MDVNDGDLICVAAVRKEIQDETDRETGRSSKQISTVPIHLSIYSPSGSSVFSLLSTVASRISIYNMKICGKQCLNIAAAFCGLFVCSFY